MEPFLGSIALFAFDWAPRGWARCDGALLSISSNTALFSLLGTTYGGNGQTTFALPDLRGRAPIHDGQGPGLSSWSAGQSAGAETVTLTTANLPAHNHGVQATATAASKSPAGNVPAYTADASSYGASDGTTMAATMTANTGNSQPVSITQPVLAMNYCIAIEGIYPSRP
jgi:microcystin-dependent protein